jgi:pSer/pThr/pTyr-binding forkhead associated (FHA) protein
VIRTGAPPSAEVPRNAWVIWGNRSIGVAEGDTILGRALDATIRFDVPGVSRRHARISVAGASVTVEDLGSQNGTYLRGEKINGRAALADGDELRIGPVSMLIRLVSPDSSTIPM